MMKGEGGASMDGITFQALLARLVRVRGQRLDFFLRLLFQENQPVDDVLRRETRRLVSGWR